jgi:hypothetical protein
MPVPLAALVAAAVDAEPAAYSDGATAVALVAFVVLSLVTFHLAAHCDMRPFHRHP